MRPLLEYFWAFESERFRTASRVDRERRQCVRDFDSRGSLRELHGPEMMPMQTLREIAQHWVVLVCRHSLDDQLLARDAQRERSADLQQRVHATSDARGCTFEQRMPGRINRVLVQSDRKLDQKIRKFLRQRGGGFPNRRKAAHRE